MTRHRTVADMLGNAIVEKTIDVLLDPNVPVPNAQAPVVAKQIEAAVKPVIVNATNSEAWYQSRIFRGLLLAALGYLGSKIGLVIGEGDVTELIQIGAALFEAGGLLYAWYGRVVGASKKPLGAS